MKYFVIGMGRSGTSLLSRSLSQQGIKMWNNQYFDLAEDKEIVDLHIKMISDVGGCPWVFGQPLSREDAQRQAEKYLSDVVCLLKKVDGVKDPRLTVFLEYYFDEILKYEDDPFIFVCLRRPEKVADSILRITKKKGFSISKETCLNTAKSYNKLIIDFIKKYYI